MRTSNIIFYCRIKKNAHKIAHFILNQIHADNFGCEMHLKKDASIMEKLVAIALAAITNKCIACTVLTLKLPALHLDKMIE